MTDRCWSFVPERKPFESQTSKQKLFLEISVQGASCKEVLKKCSCFVFSTGFLISGVRDFRRPAESVVCVTEYRASTHWPRKGIWHQVLWSPLEVRRDAKWCMAVLRCFPRWADTPTWPGQELRAVTQITWVWNIRLQTMFPPFFLILGIDDLESHNGCFWNSWTNGILMVFWREVACLSWREVACLWEDCICYACSTSQCGGAFFKPVMSMQGFLFPKQSCSCMAACHLLQRKGISWRGSFDLCWKCRMTLA